MSDADLEFLRDYVHKNVKEEFAVTVEREGIATSCGPLGARKQK